MRAIITVLDSISHTTMPYNEFILYREKKYADERQIVFLTGNEIAIPADCIPESLEIYNVGKNPLRIRRKIMRLIGELEREGVEWIIHLHSIRGSFSTLLALITSNYRKHTVYTIHSTFTGFRLHNKLFSLANSMLANYVVFVSNASYSVFPKLVKCLKKEKMKVIQNGVSLERIDALNLKDVCVTHGEDTEIRCVYVARMVPLKNHRFLIELLPFLKENIHFIFVGKEDKSIIDYSKQLGVENRIEFTGLIPREKVYCKLAESDLYISSSTLEGLPVSVLEGMYCGLPAILSDIPQHREIVENFDDVKLIGYDIEKWADAINEFAKLSIEERTEMGKRCKQYVTDNFSLNRMHQKYTTLYELLLEHK